MSNLFISLAGRWGRALALLGLTAGPLAAQAQPTGYCETGLGGVCGTADVVNVVIAGTTLSNPNTTCNTNGAGDVFTLWPATGSTTATLSPGVPYQVSVTTAGPAIISVWGDWNRNGQFEASEWTQITTFSTTGTASTATVVVPATALAGLTRFRVRSRSNGNPNGAGDACLNFGSGEAEDYVVTIGPPPACAPPINLAVGNVSTTTATLTFSGASNGTAVGYVVQYGPVGFVPGAPNSTTVNTTATSVPLTGLTANTEYEFYVTKDCGGGSSSVRNGPFRFRTACVAPNYAPLPFLETFETTWVNGCGTRDIPSLSWLNTPFTGNLSWRRDDDPTSANWTSPTFGSFPVSGAQGLHAARFHDYDASVAGAGLSGTLDLFVDLSSTGAKVAQFDYINTSGTDSLLVEFSTDGGGTFGRALLRLGVSAAFSTRTVSLPATTSATAVIRFRAKTDSFGSTDIGLDNVRVAPLVGVPGCVTNASPANGATGIQRPVTLSWQPGTGIATGYDVYFGTSATALTLVSSNQPGTSYAITTSLAGNTTYYYQIVPRNGNGPATGCTVFSFMTNNVLTYCTTGLGGFCGGNDITAVAIPTTTLNNPNTVCNTVAGDAYTQWPASGSTTATLLPGATYQVSVTTDGASIISVWGDWNQNGQFEPSEWTQIATTSTANQPATVAVTVPANALPGQTVLRVRSRASGNPNGASDGCASFGSGETEDYVVNLGPVLCAAPTNLVVGTVTGVTAQLSWTATPATGATFTVVYGPTGFTPGGMGGTSVTGITGTSTTLTGLNPTTPYQVFVQQVCGGTNGSSAFTGPVSFTTPINIPANDDPCGALPLTGTAQSSTNQGATTSVQPGINLPACSPSAAPRDVWFTYTPTVNGLSLTITGTAAGMVRLFTLTDCANGPLVQVDCQAATASNIGFPNPVVFGNLTAGQRYYVAVSGYGSSDPLGSFTVAATSVLGSRTGASATALLVHPNPSANGHLALRLPGGSAAQATLVNALGQPVRGWTLAAGGTEQTVSTQGLAAGVYTLRVQAGSQWLTRKVVLE